MFAIVQGPIDAASVRAAVGEPRFGAVVVFEGVARSEEGGRRVLSLSYEAWPDLAIAEMAAIGAEAEARWDCRVAVVHRIGQVPIGENAVVIAVGTPHRAEAYEASRFVIDELKRRVPVWKKEVYEDGSAWKANPAAGQ